MTRTDTDQRGVASAWNVRAVRRELSRYDFVLGVIPVLLSASAVGALVSDLPVEPLVGVAALACLVAIADVLFVHPPDDLERGEGDGTPRTRRRRTG